MREKRKKGGEGKRGGGLTLGINEWPIPGRLVRAQRTITKYHQLTRKMAHHWNRRRGGGKEEKGGEFLPAALTPIIHLGKKTRLLLFLAVLFAVILDA